MYAIQAKAEMSSMILILLALVGTSLAVPDSRIIGGSNADIADYPYQCSLRYSGSHTCGCVILSSRKILTAAHCVDGRSVSLFSILAGQSNRTKGVAIPFSSFRTHPDYNNGAYTFYNDVATATLSGTVDLEDSNIEVGDLAQNSDGTFDGVECTLTGWGRTNSSNTLPYILQRTDMSAVSNSNCQSSLSSSGGNIGPGHICFSTYNTGACNGDSGGPVNCNNKIAGVASWVVTDPDGNCRTSYPSVYARLSEYHDWISDA